MTEVGLEQVGGRSGDSRQVVISGKNSGDASPSSPDKPKKRRRSAKIITEKKFDCKHPGCGRQYSRAEHLYRHQLNRKILGLSIGQLCADHNQTIRSKFTGATIPTALGNSSVKICAFGIENGTQHMDHNCNDGTISLRALVDRVR